MIDFNDYENAGYVVLQQVLPEFEKAYSIVLRRAGIFKTSYLVWK